jgi:hypothetical protein
MTSRPSPECYECKHFHRDPNKKPYFFCAAFPFGIPGEIFFRGRSHRAPYPGDHGILFEPKERPKG